MTIALLVQVVVVGGILRILDIFARLSSSSNRFGCFRGRKNKPPNPKDSRFRVSISGRPSDHLRQRSDIFSVACKDGREAGNRKMNILSFNEHLTNKYSI